MSLSLPPEYTLEGAVEGKRTLYEERPVYKIVPGGVEAPISHDFAGNKYKRRKVATFARKSTKRQIERIAWLDYDAQHTENPGDRQRYLVELAREFRGEPLLEVVA